MQVGRKQRLIKKSYKELKKEDGKRKETKTANANYSVKKHVPRGYLSANCLEWPRLLKYCLKVLGCVSPNYLSYCK